MKKTFIDKMIDLENFQIAQIIEQKQHLEKQKDNWDKRLKTLLYEAADEQKFLSEEQNLKFMKYCLPIQAIQREIVKEIKELVKQIYDQDKKIMLHFTKVQKYKKLSILRKHAIAHLKERSENNKTEETNNILQFRKSV